MSKTLNIHYNEIILSALSTFVVIINKYVLSVLHFTKPTVFQGWQTFVCVVSLSSLIKWTRFHFEIQILDQKTVTSLIIPFLCFTLGNVAGSKALAEMPVGIYLASSNIVPAGLFLMKTQKNTGRDAASITIVATVIFLHFISSIHPITWFWMLVNILSQQIQQYFLANHRLSPVSIVYYSNFSSVIILLPLSVYLQEATSAIDHAQHASLEFFFGCLTSGVLGTMLQLLIATSQNSSLLMYQGIAKIMACLISLIIFKNELSAESLGLICINLIVGSLVFADVEKVPLTETAVF